MSNGSLGPFCVKRVDRRRGALESCVSPTRPDSTGLDRGALPSWIGLVRDTYYVLRIAYDVVLSASQNRLPSRQGAANGPRAHARSAALRTSGNHESGCLSASRRRRTRREKGRGMKVRNAAFAARHPLTVRLVLWRVGRARPTRQASCRRTELRPLCECQVNHLKSGRKR